MSERIVVLCSVGTAADADRIATLVVERGLAACVNVLPGVRSVYRWQGQLEREEEHLLVVKTRAERFEALREAIVAAHPYQTPELIALPIVAGHAPYLAWLDQHSAGSA